MDMPRPFIFTRLDNLAPGDLFAWIRSGPLCYVEPTFKPPGLVPWQMKGLSPSGVYAMADLYVYYYPKG